MLKRFLKWISTNKFLILIIILGLILRFIGINHGLPFVFHPDEPSVVRSALAIRFDPNPGHFDWPHLYFYMNFIVYMIFAKLRLLLGWLSLRSSLPILWQEPDIFYLLTRLLSATLGVLAVIPIYLSAKRLFNFQVGLIASLLFVIFPFHVLHSHYSLPDAPMLFFLGWALYFCVLIMKNHQSRNYLFAGLFVGLSASMKYNGGLWAIGVFFAHSFRVIPSKKERILSFKGLGQLCAAGISAVIGFLIGTPYALLDYETFSIRNDSRGAFWQFKNVGTVGKENYLGHLFSNVFSKLPDDFGYTIFYIFILVSFFTLYATVVSYLNNKIQFKEKYPLLLLVLPTVLIVLFLSRFDSARSHYFFIIFPQIAIGSAYFLSLIHNALLNKLKKFVHVFWFLILFLPLSMSINNSLTFYRGDTRLKVLEFLKLPEYSNSQVVYNDNRLDSILSAAPQQSFKGFDNIGNNVFEGIVLLSFDDQTELQLYLDQLSSASIKELFYASSEELLGPNIYVYKLN